MSHLDAPQSKRIKLTQDEDTKRENAIDNGRSVANSKGKKEKHGKEVDFLEPLGQM